MRQSDGGGHPEVITGAWVYRLARRCAADFIALLDQVLRAFPQASANTAVTWPGRLRQIRSFFRAGHDWHADSSYPI